MKFNLKTVAGMLSLAASLSTAHATILAYEPFNYPTGAFNAPASTATGTPTATTGGGFSSWFSGAAGASIVAGLTYASLPTGNNALQWATSINYEGENLTTIITPATYGTVYVSFLYKAPSYTANKTGLALDAAHSNNTGLYLGMTASGTFGVASVDNGSGTVLGTATGTISFNATYFIVVKLVKDSGGTYYQSGNIYINPTPGAAEPAASGTFTGTYASADRIGDFLTLGSSVITDEIRIGTTWADVTPASVSPPATPTGLTVTSSGANTVSLSWTASTGSPTSYNVKRSTTSSGTYTTIGTTTSPTVTFTDSLTGGSTYYYEVSAVNAGGESANSSPGVPASPTLGVPNAPTGLAATPGDGQVALSWTAPAVGNPTSYNVKRGTVNTGPYTTLTTAGAQTTTSYTDVSGPPVNGTTYYYVVSAVNATGEGANSSQVTATPAAFVKVYEPFNYSTGSFVNNTAATGTGLTGNWTCGANGTVVSSLTYANLPTANNALQSTGNRQYVSFASSLTRSGTKWISFLMTHNAGDLGTNIRGVYFPNGTTSGLFFGYGLQAYNGAQGYLGLGSIDTTGNAATGATDLIHTFLGTFATTYLVVISIQYGSPNDTITVYLNPTANQGSPSVAATYTYSSFNVGTITGIGLNVQAGSVILDEVRTGLTFGDVVGYVSVSPPAAPTNLGATAGNGQVALSWTASTGSPTSYNVLRSATSGSGYATIGTTTSPTVTYTDSTAVNGIKYYYVVQGVNAGGASGNSSEVNATPMAAPTISSAVASTAQVVLSWGSVSGATSYNMLRSTTSGAETSLATGVTSPYTDATAASGTKYYYKVQAANASGTVNSAEVNATPMAAPTISSAVGGINTVAVTWAGITGATSYNVKRSGTSGGTYTTVGTTTDPTVTYNDGTAIGNSTYYYEVSAVNASGESANSAFAGPVTPTIAPPTAPTALTATAANGAVTLNWSGGTGAATYNVLRGTSTGTETSLTTGVTGATYTDSTPANGTQYFYVVQGVNTAGTSGNSPEANATPMAPPSVTPVAGTAQVVLSWGSVSGATSYNMLRGTSAGGETSLATGVTSPYTDATAVNGTTNYYKVQAVNASGSVNSAEVNATPMAPPTVTPAAGDAQVVLTWGSVAGATSYNVLASTTSGGETTLATGVTSPYTDSTAANGTTNYYKVQAVNASGSVNSAEVNATPMAAPTISSAVAGTAQVVLTWGSVAGATSYNVLRATTSGAETNLATGVTSPYTNSTAVNGMTNYYKVQAVNASGSVNSAETNATPMAPPSVTPAAGTAQVVLTWGSVAGATSYNVLASTTSGGETSLATGVTSPYTDATAANGTKYYYKVQAVNASGLVDSAETNATPMAAPTISSAVAGVNTVAVTWAGSTGATGYNVKRSTTSGSGYTTLAAGANVSGPSLSDTTAISGTTYYYVVSAVNASGESANSSQSSGATPTGPPQAPTGLTATEGNNQVSLSWTAALGAPTSYNVKRSTTSGSGYTTITTSGAQTTTSYTDATAVNGTTYYYVVSAVNASGEGAISSQASATPAAFTNAYEPFNYGSIANGTAVTGTGESGTWTCGSTPSIVTGLTYSGLSTANSALQSSGGRQSVTFANSISSGTKWISFLFQSGPGNSGGNINGVYLPNGGTGLFFGFGLAPYSGTQGGLGIGSTTTTGTSAFVGASNLASSYLGTYGSVYFVAIQIQYGAGTGGNDLVTVYLNPTANSATPVVAATYSVGTFSVGTITGIGLTVQGGGNITVDEIRTGRSYGDVSGYVPPPTGSASQSFCSGSSPTVASLVATGTAIQWYAASSGGTALATSTALANNTHYYASQTIGGSESASRLDVTATVNPTPSTSAISGSTTVTHGTTNTYSVTATSGSSYGWSVPANATYTGGMGHSISVTFSTNSGSVSVIETNASGCTGSQETLAVTVTNHAPVANVMNVLRTPGEQVLITLSDLATNWSDADGDAVRMTAFNGVTTNGVNLTPLNLTTNLDGSYVMGADAWLGYTNNANLNDQFSYSIADGFGGTNIGYVNIVVDPFVAGQVISGQQTTNTISGPSFTVTYYGIPGYTYLLERSTNLTDWVDISTNTIGSGGMTNVVDDFGDLSFVPPSSAYYRVGWKSAY